MKVNCLYDKLVSIQDLSSHPKNPNTHSSEQIARLAQILEYQGFRYPIKVSKLSGFVTSGHGRIEAAKKNGWKEVPVNYQDYESTEQEYADLVADNSIAEWSELDLGAVNSMIPDLGPDFNVDLLGLKDFEIDLIDKLEPGCDEDTVPEVKETICKPGDLFILGNHRLLCGDSTNIQHVERLMNNEKADMVFTDPPYGINEKTDRDFASRSRITSGGSFKKIANDHNSDCAIECWNLIQSLNPKYQIYWGANHFANNLEASPSWIVWDKREEDKERDANSDAELAWCKGHNKSVRIFRHKWKGMIKASEHGQARVHPTQKPIALAEWCFENYGNPLSVLDLFGGSGSTLIACEKSNRKCFIMELDQEYCDVIIQRWEKYSNKKAYHENGLSYQELKESNGQIR